MGHRKSMKIAGRLPAGLGDVRRVRSCREVVARSYFSSPSVTERPEAIPSNFGSMEYRGDASGDRSLPKNLPA